MEFKRAQREAKPWDVKREERLLEEILWELQDNNFLLAKILDAVNAINPTIPITGGKMVLGIPVPQ